MRFFFAVLTEAIQIFFSSAHLPSVSVPLQYPLSMRIHDCRFPESASFKRKEQGVREEGRGEKEKYRPSRRTIGIFGGGRWISPDGDKLRLHLPGKEKYQSPKRVIGIFGGGRWIRTIEGIASRFTVCPLWPLGNSPICNLSVGGAGRRTRTPDLLITNQLLYQLSYTSTTPAYVS